MPNINVSVPHQLSQDEALRRIQAYIAKLKVQYADTISDLDENWNGYVGSFSASGMGQTITGNVFVNLSEVSVEVTLPFVAMLFKGKIESGIREHLGRLLA